MPRKTARSRSARAVPITILAAFAALTGLAGCGKGRTTLAPYQPTPIEVVATSPAARSTGVLYDSPISVDFGVDMDASTFTSATVRLKLDTQRVPLRMTYDAPTRRLNVYPQEPLALRRTYTVEFTDAVRTSEGRGFGTNGWFFQFTTNGTRRPLNARPGAGTANESPFAMLAWDSTEAGIGAITYQVYSGVDSSAVAARSGSPTATTTKARLLPAQAWPLGTKIFWAVTVNNAASGEQLAGPVQSFSTLPPGLPEDSLLVRASDYGFNYINFNVSANYPYQFCNSDSIVSASGVQGWFVFPLVGLPADVRLASARLEVYTFPHYVARLATTQMFLWSDKYAWPLPCRPSTQFRESLPVQDQAVATGRQESDRRVLFASDLLASHVEASSRFGGGFGYEFLSGPRLAFVTPRAADPTLHPYLKIHYFRTLPRPELTVRP